MVLDKDDRIAMFQDWRTKSKLYPKTYRIKTIKRNHRIIGVLLQMFNGKSWVMVNPLQWDYQ